MREQSVPAARTNVISKGKPQSMMKPQDQHDTVKAGLSKIIRSRFTTSTTMATDHQRISRRILGHLCKKERREPSTIDQIIIVREGACQIKAEAMAEAHSSLRTVCIIAVIQTNA
jgi:hypothetical protein